MDEQTPAPTELGAMKPHERRAMLDAARRDKDAAARRRMAEQVEAVKEQTLGDLIEHPKNREERLHNRTLRQQAADREVVLQCAEEHKFPVRLGNLLGPEGNVFNVIGAVRSGIRWAEDHGVYVGDEGYAIVNGFTKRTYAETLRLIEEHALDLDGSIDAYFLGVKGEMGARSVRFGDNPIGGLLGQ